MHLSTAVRLKELRLLIAIALCLSGVLLFFGTIFSSPINIWLSTHAFLSLSASILLLAVGSLLIFKSPLKEKTYTLRQVQGLKISYTPQAITDAITPLLEKMFPKQEVKKDILFHKGNIHIFIDLPYHPKEQQKKILKTLESELKEHLHRLFSYENDFLLVTSFQDHTI